MDDLNAWKPLAREHRGITLALAGFIANLRPEAVPAATRRCSRKRWSTRSAAGSTA